MKIKRKNLKSLTPDLLPNGAPPPDGFSAPPNEEKKSLSDKLYRTPAIHVALYSALAGLAACVLAFLILLICGLRIHTDRDHNGNTVRYFGIMSKDRPVFGTIYQPEGVRGYVFGKTVKFSDGSKYSGQVIGLNFNGEGVYKDSEGNTYKGIFVNGLIEGKGEATYSDGSTYAGGFHEGKRDGYGELTLKDGGGYKGYHSEDKKSGYGVYTYPDGSVYKGYFKDDMRHGQGSYRFACQDSYTGEFRNNIIWGQGSYFFASGRVFTGEFRNGVPVT